MKVRRWPSPWVTVPVQPVARNDEAVHGRRHSTIEISAKISDVVTPSRRQEYEHVLYQVGAWAGVQHDIDGVAVVGSWARDEARMDSDIDTVVLTPTLDPYTTTESWVFEAVGQRAPIVRTMEWTPLIERRVRLASGFEIEFNFVTASWALDRPVHPSTAAMINAGCLALVDPHELIAGLIAASKG